MYGQLDQLTKKVQTLIFKRPGVAGILLKSPPPFVNHHHHHKPLNIHHHHKIHNHDNICPLFLIFGLPWLLESLLTQCTPRYTWHWLQDKNITVVFKILKLFCYLILNFENICFRLSIELNILTFKNFSSILHIKHKNPAYGRQSISQLMQIVAPMP